MKTTEKTSDTPTTDLMEWSLSNKPITGREAEILNFARNLERSRDTWTSGKILPTPSEPHLVVEEFLAVRKDSESINMETYWFDGGGWQDADENPIQISAWRRIPMDGIDEAVRLGDLA